MVVVVTGLNKDGIREEYVAEACGNWSAEKMAESMKQGLVVRGELTDIRIEHRSD